MVSLAIIFSDINSATYLSLCFIIKPYFFFPAYFTMSNASINILMHASWYKCEKCSIYLEWSFWVFGKIIFVFTISEIHLKMCTTHAISVHYNLSILINTILWNMLLVCILMITNKDDHLLKYFWTFTCSLVLVYSHI